MLLIGWELPLLVLAQQGKGAISFFPMAELVGPRLYSCYNCSIHVALHDDLILKTFQIELGYFSYEINVPILLDLTSKQMYFNFQQHSSRHCSFPGVFFIRISIWQLKVDPMMTPADICKVHLFYMELFHIDFAFLSFFKNYARITSLLNRGIIRLLRYSQSN